MKNDSRSRRPVRLLRACGVVSGCGLALVVIALIGLGGVWYWRTHRPQPHPVAHQPLFLGMTYTREVRRDPRPMVIHVVRVNLDAPGIKFLVTPGDPVDGYHLRARKTSQFLGEFDLQVAINGSFFEPYWSHNPWDYYPHTGDPVNVLGLSSSQGDMYSPALEQPGGAYLPPNLYISANNEVSITVPPRRIYNALSGGMVLLRDGELAFPFHPTFYDVLEPRTAVGVDRAGRSLILVVVDGRQPNYSEGITRAELAALLLSYGAYQALMMDCGASSTLVIENGSGQPDVVNSPIDNLIPGRERPVANHLGIWAQPLATFDPVLRYDP